MTADSSQFFGPGDEGHVAELDRIGLPSPSVFYRDYMAKLQPVVIRDLFDGQAIRRLSSRHALVSELGAMRIPLGDEYDHAIGIEQVRLDLRERSASLGVASAELPPEEASVAEYFALVERTRGGSKARVSFAAPARLRECFQAPDVCAAKADESAEVLSTCFVGNRGSFSHLHFDKDGSHGLLYEVYGRKRFIVIPASAGRRLPSLTQFSVWFLQNFSDSERHAFLKYVGGVEVVLEAGDAIYLPPFCWHFADYLEDCWAVSLRFRRSRRVRTLVNNFFPDTFTQVIGTKLLLGDTPEQVRQQLLTEVEQAAAEAFTDGRERVRKLRERAQELCLRYELGAGPPYAFAFEQHFPSPLPHFLDSHDPRRPQYN